MIVCYVTDRKLLAATQGLDALAESIARAARAGADWIQIREKDLSARVLLELSRQAVLDAPTSTRILINDRLDVALAAGAAGVHLGRASAPAAEVVKWCRAGNAPQNFLVGVSCHEVEEAKEAERAGADYVFFGPVFETPSKAAFGPPQGLELLGETCRSVHIPVLAIGGTRDDNAANCRSTGAAGIAAIRLFQEAESEAQLAGIVSRLHALK